MSMLDSFFNKGFKAAKCKTLLKLTVPRIKLLRNRREIQLKQMRRDVAKLLETGQEATARIRVEHIIREEKMMAAQEIIELFCELIIVRLPIIEAQRECPLDLKEAISSVCFSAPRCADLPELLQFQMLCIAKYGKEFVAAATELMPECGVNRQLIELLSVRAPEPDVKLKLLKEISEEHELDWDPAASENELLKSHEDLLSVPTNFVSVSKLPLPDESLNPGSEQALNEVSDSDTLDFPEVPKETVGVDTLSVPEIVRLPESVPTNFVSVSKLPLSDESLNSGSEQALNEVSDSDTLDFPEVPKETVRVGIVSVPEMVRLPEVDFESEKHYDANELNLDPIKMLQGKSVASGNIESPENSVSPMEDKQFVPFISSPPPLFPRIKIEANADLQDVLAAAHAAAETAEHAATAARSAASLAQMRITELIKKKDDASDRISENPFHTDTRKSPTIDITHLSHQNSSRVSNSPKVEFDSSSPVNSDVHGHEIDSHQPQRLTSMDDETYLPYPNLFSQQDSNVHP